MAQPLKKYRAGPIAAALWENPATVNGRDLVLLKVTVERRYKDKTGSWQSSNSFGRNEIPLVIHVLNQAFADIVGEQQKGENADDILSE